MKGALAAVLLLALTLAPAAGSAIPGTNGRIAYRHAGQLWTSSPDGGSARGLVALPPGGSGLSWAPDGVRLAFGEYVDDGGALSESIFSVNDADGAVAIPLTHPGQHV